MLVLVAVLLTLLPAIAIIYPFVRSLGHDELPEDEISPEVELGLRWDAALAGLKSAELDWTIGRLAEGDYRWLRQRYMTEAAVVMKAMEIEEDQQGDLLASIERELEEARVRAMESEGAEQPTCPECSTTVQPGAAQCPECGISLAAGATQDPDLPHGTSRE
jgi:hypothetical protein